LSFCHPLFARAAPTLAKAAPTSARAAPTSAMGRKAYADTALMVPCDRLQWFPDY
jgi:hypothetical protein